MAAKYIASMLVLLLLTIPSLAESGVVLEGGWVRPTPPGFTSTAAYGELVNKSKAEVKITGLSADVAAKAELHRTVVDAEGMAHMRRIEELVIPPWGRVKLEPGGLHVMLTGLKSTLEKGQMVHLLVRTADGARFTLMFHVKSTAAADVYYPH